MPKTTTYGIVAAAAPIAVIFRRGPTRVTRMLLWDLRTDEIRGGQWLRGTVYVGPSAVSPSGELVLYAARKGPRTYTVVSRPPYFTALALWENGTGWTGGGFFASDQHLVLGLPYADPHAAGEFPQGFEITDVWTHFVGTHGDPRKLAELVPRAPEANHGWRRPDARGPYRKPSPVRPELELERAGVAGRPAAYRIVSVDARGEARGRELGSLDWADWAPDGSVISGAHGGLHRSRVPVDLDSRMPAPSLVADLSEQSFERILAPEDALRWPPPRRANRRRERPPAGRARR